MLLPRQHVHANLGSIGTCASIRQCSASLHILRARQMLCSSLRLYLHANTAGVLPSFTLLNYSAHKFNVYTRQLITQSSRQVYTLPVLSYYSNYSDSLGLVFILAYALFF